MTIAFNCPHCQKSYKVPDEFAGRQTNCKDCKKPMRVPGTPATVAAPAATKPAAAPAAPAPAATNPPAPAAPATMARAPAAPAKPAVPPAVSKPAAAPAPPAKPVAPPTKPAAPAPSPSPATKPAADLPDTKQPPAVKPAAAAAHAAPAAPAPAAAPAKPPAVAAPAQPLAAATAEAPPTPGPKVPTIDFNCEWCDEPIHAGLELEGKRMPCPSCKRIIKVPVQVQQQPKDWRKIDTKPAGLLRKDAADEPKDAWGSSAVSTVSRQALEEAGVIPEEKEPLTRAQKIQRGAAVAVVVLLLWGLYAFIGSWLDSRDRDKAVLRLYDYLQARTEQSPLDLETGAEIHRALGVFYGRAALPQDARDEFRIALGCLQAPQKMSNDREVLLLDITLGLADLGGSREQVIEQTHLSWEDATHEIAAALAAQRSEEVRAETLRLLCRKLLDGGKLPDVSSVVRQARPEDVPEALAVIGLEHWRLQQRDQAEALAERAQRELDSAASLAKTSKRPAPLAPSLLALWLVLDKKDKTKAFKPAGNDAREVFAFSRGSLEGEIRLGQAEDVRKWVRGLSPTLDKLRYLALAAAVALDKNPADSADLDEIVQLVAKAKGPLEDKAPGGKPDLSWLLWRLVRVAAKAGHTTQATTLAGVIPDVAIRGRAQLAILQASLEQASGEIDLARAAEVDDKAPAHRLAKEAIARHNARFSGWGVRKIDQLLPDGNQRPFGYAGIALGIQDRQQ